MTEAYSEKIAVFRALQNNSEAQSPCWKSKQSFGILNNFKQKLFDGKLMRSI